MGRPADSLCSDILGYLNWQYPDFFKALEHALSLSAQLLLRKEQQQWLQNLANGQQPGDFLSSLRWVIMKKSAGSIYWLLFFPMNCDALLGSLGW